MCLLNLKGHKSNRADRKTVRIRRKKKETKGGKRKMRGNEPYWWRRERRKNKRTFGKNRSKRKIDST